MGGSTPKSITQRQRSSSEATIPDFLKPFLTGAVDVGQGALGDLRGLTESFAVPELTTQALEGSARGDFLFGGPGFDQAVDAAVRAAQPHILSTFGAAGRGTGGLAQAAIAQQATDAFASQFGQERQRQLGAAQALPGLALMPLELQRLLLGSALSPFPSVQGLFGQKGRASQTQPLFQNPLATGIGAGVAGLGLLFPPSEAATAAGGFGGGLLGGLGGLF